MRVDHDHLVVFVHRVLRHPVRVEHAQTRARTADALLRLGAVVAAPLVLPDAAVARLAVVVALGLNHLARAALHAHAVDAEALLGLVAKVARLVRARRPRRAVDDGQVAVLPAAHAQEEADRVRLLLLPELIQVAEGSHVRAERARRRARDSASCGIFRTGKKTPGHAGSLVDTRKTPGEPGHTQDRHKKPHKPTSKPTSPPTHRHTRTGTHVRQLRHT